MKKVLFVYGTRPEAIKMAPVIRKFIAQERDFSTAVCVTAQHREMLDSINSFFGIVPEYDLDLMQSNQTLFDITARGIQGLRQVFEEYRPDIVFVQGDTTTAFIGALAGYYMKTRVAHIEAGLRSGNKYSPFPEEINRMLAGCIADYHFAPTELARKNLAQENITKNVFVVGNTVIDALYLGLNILSHNEEEDCRTFFRFLDPTRKIILVTGHRRESFGGPFVNICTALREIALAHPEIDIVYPVHLNPNVRKPVFEILHGISNVRLIEPLSYPLFIWLMNRAHLILTDSGGVQEEAPSLGKPILVMRDVTERQEGIDAGTALLVGTEKENITRATSRLLSDAAQYKTMAQAKNPYGDGTASDQIALITSNLP